MFLEEGSQNKPSFSVAKTGSKHLIFHPQFLSHPCIQSLRQGLLNLNILSLSLFYSTGHTSLSLSLQYTRFLFLILLHTPTHTHTHTLSLSFALVTMHVFAPVRFFRLSHSLSLSLFLSF